MLRPFEKQDSSQCFNVILEAVKTMEGLNEAARDYVSLNSNPDTIFEELSELYSIVFEENGKILGLGALNNKEVTRVYVAPHAQGQGIGSTIVRALEKQAKQKNLTTLEAKASPSAVSLYKKLGFKKIRSGCYRDGKAKFHYIVMRKMLRSAT